MASYGAMPNIYQTIYHRNQIFKTKTRKQERKKREKKSQTKNNAIIIRRNPTAAIKNFEQSQ